MPHLKFLSRATPFVLASLLPLAGGCAAFRPVQYQADVFAVLEPDAKGTPIEQVARATGAIDGLRYEPIEEGGQRFGLISAGRKSVFAHRVSQVNVFESGKVVVKGHGFFANGPATEVPGKAKSLEAAKQFADVLLSYRAWYVAAQTDPDYSQIDPIGNVKIRVGYLLDCPDLISEDVVKAAFWKATAESWGWASPKLAADQRALAETMLEGGFTHFLKLSIAGKDGHLVAQYSSLVPGAEGSGEVGVKGSPAQLARLLGKLASEAARGVAKSVPTAAPEHLRRLLAEGTAQTATALLEKGRVFRAADLVADSLPKVGSDESVAPSRRKLVALKADIDRRASEVRQEPGGEDRFQRYRRERVLGDTILRVGQAGKPTTTEIGFGGDGIPYAWISRATQNALPVRYEAKEIASTANGDSMKIKVTAFRQNRKFDELMTLEGSVSATGQFSGTLSWAFGRGRDIRNSGSTDVVGRLADR
jgi:hypothetical protein